MDDLEKRYRKYRRPQKPEMCQHCRGRRMVPRGELWGCFDCGRWEGQDRTQGYQRQPEGER